MSACKHFQFSECLADGFFLTHWRLDYLPGKNGVSATIQAWQDTKSPQELLSHQIEEYSAPSEAGNSNTEEHNKSFLLFSEQINVTTK